MREWCNCGASIRALRRDVIVWRTTHRHSKDVEPDPEPDKNGTECRVIERAGARSFEQVSGWYGGQDVPVVNARIGFTPNA